MRKHTCLTVTCRYPVLNEYIALPRTDQEMIEIAFIVVAPAEIVWAIFPHIAENPLHISVNSPHENGLVPSNIVSTYHASGTSYMEAGAYDELLNWFIYSWSFMHVHHSGVSCPSDDVVPEASDDIVREGDSMTDYEGQFMRKVRSI